MLRLCLCRRRYDLFYLDDDEQDPFEQLKQKKQKAAVKAAVKGATATQPGQLITQTSESKTKAINVNSKTTAEKENNKSASNKNQNNEQAKAGAGGNAGGNKQGTNNAQRPKTGVKDSQNGKSQDNRNGECH